MTDALKMEPDGEARAVRAILGMSAIRKEEKFVPLILEIEDAFRDGAKAERERILKMLREPSDELLEELRGTMRRPWTDQARCAAAVVADAIEADTT